MSEKQTAQEQHREPSVGLAENDYRSSLIKNREERVAIARGFNLLSNVFMSVALNDLPACQHVIRILTGIKDLTVKEIRTQYRISKITSHDAILDVLAEDAKGKLINLEIQRGDTVDHARRTRFYCAMIDSELLEKGKEYYEMPEVYVIYISENDIWKDKRTTYPVKKQFVGTEITCDDGLHVLYVNAAIDDGTEIANLMKYFKKADPADMSQGDLSRRIHFLKYEEGGYKVMCQITEKFVQEGIEIGKEIGNKEGIEIGKKEAALNLAKRGIELETIAEIVNESVSLVKQWLDGGMLTKI